MEMSSHRHIVSVQGHAAQRTTRYRFYMITSLIQILCNCSPSPEIVNCHVTIIMSVEMDRMRRFNSRCPACVGMYGNVSVDVGKEECFPGSDVFIMWQLQHVTSGN